MHIHWQGRNIARKAPNNFRRPRDVAQGRTTRRWPGPTPSPFLLSRKSRDFWGPRWASQSQIVKNRCDFGALSLWTNHQGTLRAKGTLISEPRFSTRCEMRFFPREKGENGLLKEKPSTKAVFPFLAWEKPHLAGGRKSGLTN